MKVEQGGKVLLFLLPLLWTRSDLQHLFVGINKMVDATSLRSREMIIDMVILEIPIMAFLIVILFYMRCGAIVILASF